jgi:hypothetical protein
VVTLFVPSARLMEDKRLLNMWSYRAHTRNTSPLLILLVGICLGSGLAQFPAFFGFLHLWNLKCLLGSRQRIDQSQVLYVIPITAILGRLVLVPVGDTGTIPFTMRKETNDFAGASCDSKKDAGDGNRWWMKWSTSQWISLWPMDWRSLTCVENET